MTSVILDNLNPTVLEQLKGMAQAHNRSLEDEIKAILEQVLETSQVKGNRPVSKRGIFRERLKEARERHGNQMFSDSAELLREDRNR